MSIKVCVNPFILLKEETTRFSAIAPLLLIMALLLAFPLSASAQDCAVWTNATDGSDTNPGTRFQPFQSFESGIGALTDGETLCVSAGEYFRGADEDGITLSLGSRNVSVLLQAFGGETEVRFSEGSWQIQSQSGSLQFRRESGETMAFGRGVANSEAINPSGLNFLHSFVVEGGSVDFQDVPTSFEASVGNPSYSNPDNSADRAPADARLEWGGTVQGTDLIYSADTRSWVISGGQPGQSRSLDLPPLAAGSSLTMAQQDAVRFPNGIVAGENTSVRVLGASTGPIEFQGNLQATGSLSFEHAGQGPLTLGLELADSGAVNLILDGSGPTTIRSLDSGDQGSIAVSVGSAGAHIAEDTRFFGSLVSSGPISSAADLEIRAATENEPVLTLAQSGIFEPGRSLRLVNTFTAPSALFLASDARISGASVLLGGAFEVSGGGRAHVQLLPSTTVEVGAFLFEDGLDIGSTTEVDLVSSETRVYGTLSLSGGLLRLEAESVQVDTLRVASGSFQGNGNTLRPNHALEVVGGEFVDTHVSAMSGAEATISSNQPLRALSSSGGTLTIEGSLSVQLGCTATGTSIIVTSLSRLSCASIQLNEGSLDMDNGTVVSSEGSFVFQQAEWRAGADTEVWFGSLTYAHTVSPSVLGTLLRPQGDQSSISLATLTEIDRLVLPGNGHRSTLEGQLEVHGPLFTEHNIMRLLPNGVLRANSDITCDAGSLAGDPGSQLVLLGSGSFGCGDGSAINLHAVRALGTRDIISSMNLTGDFSLQAEQATIAEDLSLTIDGSMTLLGGSTSIGNGSIFTVDGSVIVSGNDLSTAGSAMFQVGQDVSFRQSIFDLGKSVLRLSSNGIVEVDRPLQLQSLFVAPGEGRRTFRIPQGIDLTDSLSVPKTALIVLSDGPITLNSSSGEAVAIIEGTIQGGAATALRFEGEGGLLSGSGTLNRLSLSMAGPSSSLRLESGPIQVSDELQLNRGRLDVSQSTFIVAATPTTPFGISAIVEQDTFSGGVAQWSQTPSNPAQREISLDIQGQVSTFLSLDALVDIGPLNNLTINVPDALNNPPVFGLTASSTLQVSGAFSLSTANRLAGVSVSLRGQGPHTVNGSTGRIEVLGGGVIDGGTTGTAGALIVSQEAAQISNMARIDTLTITNARVDLSGTQQTHIPRSATLSNASLFISGPVGVGDGLQPFSFQGTGADIIFSNQGNLVFEGDGLLDLDAASSISLSEIEGDNGFISLSGSVRFFVPAGVPRLALTSRSSALQLIGPLEIQDVLRASAGSIDLAANSLTARNAYVLLGNITFSGPPSGSRGLFQVDGNSRIDLMQSLALDRIDVLLQPGPEGIAVRSTDENPKQLSVNGGRFSMDGGELRLGQNDIVVVGNDARNVELSDVTILSDVAFESDERVSPILDESGLFPFSDKNVGEVVIRSSAPSELGLIGSNHIDALRVESTVTIPGGNATLTIGKYFVFGQFGAQVNLDTSSQLVLSEGVTLLRRGRGVLSRSPVFGGATTIAYDLDDGTFTGANRDFSIGTLITGNELPDASIAISNLLVLAGNRDASVNRVRLNRDITIADGLTIWSGHFDLDAREMTLQDGASLRLLEVDTQARPSISHSNAPLSPGSIGVRVHSASPSFVIDESVLIPAQALDSLVLTYTRPVSSETSLVLTASTEAQHIRIEGPEGASVNLFGSTLLATDSFSILGAQLRSDPLARVQSDRLFELNASASIHDNVEVRTRGSAHISGDLSGRSLIFDGDLLIEGPWNPTTELIARGASGTVQFGLEPLQVSNLTIDVEDEIVLDGPTGSAIDITGQLQLQDGRLNAKNTPVRLSSSATIGLGDASWISGTLQLQVSQGRSGVLSFPMGTDTSFMPLAMTLNEPLLAASTFSVEARNSEPSIKRGLPISRGSRQIADTDSVQWRIVSSVNFGSAVSYTLEAPRTVFSPDSEALLTWVLSDPVAEWKAPESSAGGANLSSTLLTTGLNNQGILISPSRSLRQSEWGLVQVLAGDSFGTSPATVWIGDQELGRVTSLGATPAASIGIPSSLSVPLKIGSVSASDQALSSSFHEVNVAPGAATFALAQDAGTLTISVPAPLKDGLIVLNESNSSVTVTELFPARSEIASDLAPLSFSTSIFSTDLTSAFQIVSSDGSTTFVKWDPADQALLPGVLRVTPGPMTSLTLSNGTVRDAIVATGAADELPNSVFEVTSLYPSPSRTAPGFNVTTRTPGVLQVAFYDAIGRKVHEERLRIDNALQDAPVRVRHAPALASGWYIARLVYDDGQSRTAISKGFVIQK